MKEYKPARWVLEQYEGSLDENDLRSMRNAMWRLVKSLITAVGSSFEVLQHMVLLLNALLTSKTGKIDFSKAYGENAELIQKELKILQALIDKPDFRLVALKIQHQYTIDCIAEATDWCGVTEKKLLTFQHNKENVKGNPNGYEEAKRLRELASKRYEEVTTFCSKYRVEQK